MAESCINKIAAGAGLKRCCRAGNSWEERLALQAGHCCRQLTAALSSWKSRQVLTKGALKHSEPLCSDLGQSSCDSRCFISQKSHLSEVLRWLPCFYFLGSSKLQWSWGALAAVKHTTAVCPHLPLGVSPSLHPSLNGSLGWWVEQTGEAICEKSIKIMFLIVSAFACVMAEVLSLDYAIASSGMAIRHICSKL